MYNVHNIVMSVLLLTTTVCIPVYITFTGVYYNRMLYFHKYVMQFVRVLHNIQNIVL